MIWLYFFYLKNIFIRIDMFYKLFYTQYIIKSEDEKSKLIETFRERLVVRRRSGNELKKASEQRTD